MSIPIYFLQVSLYGAIMWGIYALVWRNRPLHTISRIFLLAGLLLPVILPFIHLPLYDTPAIASYAVVLPEINLGVTRQAAAPERAPLFSALTFIYLSGCIAMALLYFRSYVRIFRRLKSGRVEVLHGRRLVMETGIGPGTLWTRIFFPAAAADAVIVRHELAHIRAGHRFDVLLLQVLRTFLWMSPAHWLLGRELKMVHEFEADRMATGGVGTEDYAALLLSQRFGVPHTFHIAHSFFHHSLKRRIMMLQKLNSPRRSVLLIAAFALTTGFLSTVLLAQTRKPAKAVASISDETPPAVIDMEVVKRNARPPKGEIRFMDGAAVFKTVDQWPVFNGDLKAYFTRNLRFTDTTVSKSPGDGRAIVQFVVSASGQVINPQVTRSSGELRLDEEALRVIRAMPAWKPGTLNGNAVPVLMTLPIGFRGDAGDGC